MLLIRQRHELTILWEDVSQENKTIPSTPVERKKVLTLGRKRGKIQAAQLGIEPRASGFAHQCSDH